VAEEATASASTRCRPSCRRRWRWPPRCGTPEKNPLRKVTRIGKRRRGAQTQGAPIQRKLHKAFLRYHDPENWPLLREGLKPPWAAPT
jgi:radical SAM superfamily enzyme YgiQ (UPF0313 family)